jgi:hypothetical protein
MKTIHYLIIAMIAVATSVSVQAQNAQRVQAQGQVVQAACEDGPCLQLRDGSGQGQRKGERQLNGQRRGAQDGSGKRHGGGLRDGSGPCSENGTCTKEA